MNKFLTIIWLATIIITTINMIHYSWEWFLQIFCLLIWCWNFVSWFLEELDRIFNN